MTLPLAGRWVFGVGLASTIFLYGLTVLNPFMGDDLVAVSGNAFIKSASNIPKVFGKSYTTRPEDAGYVEKAAVGSGLLSYRPVTTLTLFADHFIWKGGVEEFSAWGFHVTNLLLHFLSFFMFFLLAARITGHRWRSFFCALVFLAHPVFADTVNFPSYRQDMLLFIFSAASFLFWLSSRRWASYACFILALFSKETAVTFPAILFAYLLILGDREKSIWASIRKAMIDCLPYAGICAAYLVIWVSVGSTWHQSDTTTVQTAARWLDAFWRAWIQYLDWMVYPGNIHTNFIGNGWMERASNVRSWTILVFLAAAIALVRSRHAFFYLTFYVLALLPTAATIPFVASRYLYWPSFGLLLLLFELADKLILKFRPALLPRALTAAAVLFYTVTLFTFASMTRSRVETLKDPIRTSHEILRANPEEYRAHLLMAGGYWQFGRLREALAECQEVLRLKSDPPEAFYGLLGRIYYGMQRYDEAIAAYEHTLRPNDPFLSDYYLEIGCAYAKKNEPHKAFDFFMKAKDLDPENPRVYFNQAVLCFNLNDIEGADKALRLAEERLADADEPLKKSVQKARKDIAAALSQ